MSQPKVEGRTLWFTEFQDEGGRGEWRDESGLFNANVLCRGFFMVSPDSAVDGDVESTPAIVEIDAAAYSVGEHVADRLKKIYEDMGAIVVIVEQISTEPFPLTAIQKLLFEDQELERVQLHNADRWIEAAETYMHMFAKSFSGQELPKFFQFGLYEDGTAYGGTIPTIHFDSEANLLVAYSENGVEYQALDTVDFANGIVRLYYQNTTTEFPYLVTITIEQHTIAVEVANKKSLVALDEDPTMIF